MYREGLQVKVEILKTKEILYADAIFFEAYKSASGKYALVNGEWYSSDEIEVLLVEFL